MNERTRCRHVSLVAFPDAVISTLSGIYDVMAAIPSLVTVSEIVAPTAPFAIEIVGQARTRVDLASGLSIETHRGIDEIDQTDIVIVPSVLVANSGWEKGRYPALVSWLRRAHEQGAILCSACSGVFLIAETGLFDGKAATVHWSYAPMFRKTYPAVRAVPETALLAEGQHQELITSGASSSWHDLVLYLIARYAGNAAAQLVAKFFALQLHSDGLAPYVIFDPPKDHGDALIADVQEWLAANFPVASPVEELVRRSGMPARSFKRRFTAVTGLTPIEYVQRLRVEDAKRRLEQSPDPIDEISWRVGYQDSAFFRRLFKRITGLTPGAYRRKFEIPQFLSDDAANRS